MNKLETMWKIKSINVRKTCYLVQLSNFLETGSLSKVFFFATLNKILLTWILSAIISIYDETLLSNPIDNESPFFGFCVTILVAPLIETFLFQYSVLAIGDKYKAPTNLSIAVSALLFGLAHHYNMVYIFATLLSGFFYAYLFAKIKRRESGFMACLFVASIHACNNLYGWCIMMI